VVVFVGRVLGFWVSREVFEKYKLLSEEDKERVKRFLEVVIELLSSNYEVEIRERGQSAQRGREQAQVELQERVERRRSTGLVTKLYTEAMNKLNLPPGSKVDCNELKRRLIQAGYSEYTLELFKEQKLVVQENGECVVT
jgi:hypothetical protein